MCSYASNERAWPLPRTRRIPAPRPRRRPLSSLRRHPSRLDRRQLRGATAGPGCWPFPTPWRAEPSARTWDDFLTLAAQRWALVRDELASGRLAEHLARSSGPTCCHGLIPRTMPTNASTPGSSACPRPARAHRSWKSTPRPWSSGPRPRAGRYDRLFGSPMSATGCCDPGHVPKARRRRASEFRPSSRITRSSRSIRPTCPSRSTCPRISGHLAGCGRR